MSEIFTALVAVVAVLVALLPRRWAPIALIVGACYVPFTQAVDVGPFTFSSVRILIAVGVIRAIVRGDSDLAGRANGLDIAMLLWAVSGLVRAACFTRR